MKQIFVVVGSIMAVGFMSFTSQQPDLKASMQRGKKVYDTYCLACHQVDGAGVPRMNPPLIKTSYVLGDKKRLINVILKGLNEEVEINGEYYDNPMPPQPQLSDQQVADVLTYVRNSFGNKGSAVTVAEVKAMRAKK
ncbi:MAG TPA: cytochrome c [Lacibacter sp.]|nr:cytochrome c [Lacibacter sp.]